LTIQSSAIAPTDNDITQNLTTIEYYQF